mgnify:CR=1 FL=1
MNDPSALRTSSSPQPPRPAEASASLIDRESHFTGSYRTPHDLRIDGRYEGEIECRGTVFVGETAQVNARVLAGNVIIAGQFEGEIACDSRFEILPSGRVAASVSAAVTVVHEGAFYQGELRMFRPGQERPRRPAQPAPEVAPASPSGPPPQGVESWAKAGVKSTGPAPTAGRGRRPGEASPGPAAKEEPDQGADRVAPASAGAPTPATGNGNGRHPLAAEAH